MAGLENLHKPSYWARLDCAENNARLLSAVERSFGNMSPKKEYPSFDLDYENPKALPYEVRQGQSNDQLTDYVSLFLQTYMVPTPKGSPVRRPKIPNVDVSPTAVTTAELEALKSLPEPFGNLFEESENGGNQTAFVTDALLAHINTFYANPLTPHADVVRTRQEHCWLLAQVVRRMISAIDSTITGTSLEGLQQELRKQAIADNLLGSKLLQMNFTEDEVKEMLECYHKSCGYAATLAMLQQAIIREWLLMAECLIVTFMQYCQAIIDAATQLHRTAPKKK